MAKSDNILTLSFTDEELQIINDCYRNYVMETGDVTMRRAVLMRILLLKTIKEPKVVQKIASLRRLRNF